MAYYKVWKAKIAGNGIVLIVCVHGAYMRNEFAMKVKAGHLDAIFVILDCLEYSICQTLGGFTLIIAWEHAVYISVIHREETLAYIHRKLAG